MTPNKLSEYIDVDRMQRRLNELNEIGKTSDGGVTRLAFTETETEAYEYILNELSDEYVITEDTVGNVFATQQPNATQSVLTGSHLDSVFNGGPLDGALGVVVSLEAVNAVYRADVDCAFPPTLAIFRGEESARFGHHTIGSRAALGMLDIQTLAAVDQNGVPLWKAMQDIGFQPDNLSGPSIDLESVAAFLETHIEQGRVLEEHGDDLGIVSSIRAPVRYRVTVTGNYDHSGATPMGLRQDALTAASEMVVAIEEIAEEAATDGDIVGTVGTISAVDGSINQVCGRVEFSLDLRSNDTDYRDDVESHILETIDGIATSRSVGLETEVIDRSNPVSLDDGIVSQLQSAAESTGVEQQVLPSGGGHDAMNFQLNNIPTGMVFVPSIDGVSHNPDEETTPEAIEGAAATLAHSIVALE